ncbi:MAG TPA: GNAT family N-acetyltransferase [Acidimicrobiia bacterium]|nr:GNAT family N-acetyltransferase [Acidimicrobiia bacterium]
MIRDAVLADCAELARVHVASWQEAYRGLIDQSVLDSLDVTARTETWDRIIRQGRVRVLVAEVGDQIVGFCTVGSSAEEGWGEVYSIYLSPGHWGRGLGRHLLVTGEKALAESGRERALLWVLDTNRRAREFYQRQGWVLGKPIRIERFGDQDVTEVRYEKSLSPT